MDWFSYFQLRAFLHERELQQTALFRLQELDNVWFCTTKNSKRKLKKFEQEGLFTYEPGLGRGHASRLIFAYPFHTEVHNIVQHYIEKEEVETILQLMQLPIPKEWFSDFRQNIEQLFGYHTNSQNKDTLRTVFKRNLTTLNPQFASVTFECALIRQLGDTLVVYDPETDSVHPHLAHHWTVDPHKKTWTFYLRKNILFHHQRRMTSHDVRHTFEQFQDPSCPFFWLVEEISAIECPSDFTIVIHLRKPNAFFLRFISSENLAILPRDIPFDENQWIGSGPFQLKERSNHKIVLQANDSYFLERPLIDEIEFWKVPEETFKIETYELNRTEEHLDAIHKQVIEPGFRFIVFNLKKPSIVHHASFRKAFYHIMDIKKMLRELGRDNLIEASSYFPEKSRPQRKNPGHVRVLLDQSGYQGERLILLVPSSLRAREEAEWVSKEAALYGVDIEIRFFQMEDFYSLRLEEQADLVSMGEVASIDLHLSFLGAFQNPLLLFRRFWSTENLRFIDEQLELYKNKESYHEREKIIDQIENYIKEENLLIYTHHLIRNRSFHSMIQNIQFDSYGYVDFRKLWIQ